MPGRRTGLALPLAAPERREIPQNPQIVRLGTISAGSIATLRPSRELHRLSTGAPTVEPCATTVWVVQRVRMHYAPADARRTWSRWCVP